MKAIKNRLNRLNKLAVVDEVDIVFLTQIDTGHFEVSYRIGGKNPKDIIEVYPTKEEAEKAISDAKIKEKAKTVWDTIVDLFQ